jgi:hypothetical protein
MHAPLCYCGGKEAGDLADRVSKTIDPKAKPDKRQTGPARPPAIYSDSEAELTTLYDLRVANINLSSAGAEVAKPTSLWHANFREFPR